MHLSQLLLKILQGRLSLRRCQLRNAVLRKIGLELLLHFRIGKYWRSRTVLCKPRLGRRKPDPPWLRGNEVDIVPRRMVWRLQQFRKLREKRIDETDQVPYRTELGCHPKTASVTPTPTVSTGASSGTSVGYSACVSRPPGT